ncbi:TRAP transporter substrate-binding protein [Clostridium sediminicola]|uniref:TRAP transporter substrate-binding protein n=1 Tax=Clostridium sediminicola TaxID=3114879 RepID=UPI0031F23AD6
MIRKSTMAKVFATVMSLTLLLTGCGGGNTAKNDGGDAAGGEHKEIKLRIAHMSPEEESIHQGFVKFKEIIEAENVGVTVEIYPAGQLVGSDRDSIEGVQLGEIDMASVAAIQLAPHVEKFYVFNANYLFDSMDDARAKLEGPAGDALRQATIDKNSGMRVAAFFGGANRAFWNNVKPIEKVADFKGIKVRTPENPLNVKELETLGCIPTPMAWSEMYTGLQQGTIDGLASSRPPILQQGIVEVLKYATDTNHSYYMPVSLISEATYKKFDEAQLAAYEKAIKACADTQWELTVKDNEKAIAEMEELEKEGKLTYTRLTDEQREEFKTIYVDSIEAMVAEKCGQEILDVFRK